MNNKCKSVWCEEFKGSGQRISFVNVDLKCKVKRYENYGIFFFLVSKLHKQSTIQWNPLDFFSTIKIICIFKIGAKHTNLCKLSCEKKCYSHINNKMNTNLAEMERKKFSVHTHRYGGKLNCDRFPNQCRFCQRFVWWERKK